MALVALAIVGIISMAALSIDIATLYQAKAEAQRAADAAALTAARIISISGITTDPTNGSVSWQPTCGGAGSTATLAAIAVAQTQYNFVGGVAAPTVTINYGPGGATQDCSTLVGSSFAVDPTVTATVSSGNLPIYFARIFSLIPGVNRSNATVSATASAEAFNPSGSSQLPNGLASVQPRCVKPWVVPNLDPGNPYLCTPTPGPNQCKPLVSLTPGTEGAVQNPGFQVISTGPGVIGETFYLNADCPAAGICNPQPFTPAQANSTALPPPNLQYLPGQVPITSAAVPSCASGSDPYQQAIAGCDQTTAYQCGVQSGVAATPNQLDLTENPRGAAGDTATAAQCLIGASGPGLANGQDSVLPLTSIPYQIQAGTSNPQKITGVISSSNSIVSLPIFDQTAGLNGSNFPPITIVGFLQVFINSIDAAGNVNLTVLNVAGCGNAANPNATPIVTGTSPVPIRLITPP